MSYHSELAAATEGEDNMNAYADSLIKDLQAMTAKSKSDIAVMIEEFKTLKAERNMLLYWLLRAYQSGHREGWEDGPSVAETMAGVRSVLFNLEYDTANNAERVEKVLARKPVFHV